MQTIGMAFEFLQSKKGYSLVAIIDSKVCWRRRKRGKKMREGKARSIVIQFFRDVVLTKMGAVRAAFLRSFRRLNPSTQALTHSTACLDRVSCGIPEHHPAVATKLHVPLFSLHFRFSYGISFRYCDPRCCIDYLNNKNKKRKREKKSEFKYYHLSMRVNAIVVQIVGVFRIQANLNCRNQCSLSSISRLCISRYERKKKDVVTSFA